MFKKTTLALWAMLACLAVPSLSIVSAQTYHFTVVIDGHQNPDPLADPATASTATGTANVLVDSISGDISVAGSFSGLSDASFAAHLHLTPSTLSVPYRNDPPILPFNLGGGSTARNFSATGTIDQAELAKVMNGEAHIIIHSFAVPIGEIFGNLLVANRTEVFEPGDINRDGFVNFLDLAPFIALLSSQEYQPEADFDGNFLVNFLDIAPFIAELSNQ